jgi:hypothetical protein
MVSPTGAENVKVGNRIQVWPGDDDHTPGVAVITEITESESGLKFKVDRDSVPFEFSVLRGSGLNVVS